MRTVIRSPVAYKLAHGQGNPRAIQPSQDKRCRQALGLPELNSTTEQENKKLEAVFEDLLTTILTTRRRLL